MKRTWLVLLVAFVLVGAAGCDDDGNGNGSEVRGERSPSPEVSLPDSATALGVTATEYQEYLDLIDLAVSDIEGYWIAETPELFGIEYQPPAQLIPYSSKEDAPTCGGESVGLENAVYCSAGDYIAWDEAGLLLPYYTEIGDFAVAYVLAHEYGHSVRNKSGRRRRRTSPSSYRRTAMPAGGRETQTLAASSRRGISRRASRLSTHWGTSKGHIGPTRPPTEPPRSGSTRSSSASGPGRASVPRAPRNRTVRVLSRACNP